MSEQHPRAAQQPSDPPSSAPTTPQPYPGPPGQVPPSDPRLQHPAPPPARRMHLGAIIGIIAGGALLLGLTFAGGVAVGWWFGAHHGAGWSQNGPAYPGGPGGPDPHERQRPGAPDADNRSDS